VKKVLVGCAIAAGVVVALVVAAVAIVGALGYGIWSGVSTARANREREVFARHYYPVPTAASLPEHGTLLILHGVHPTKASEDGHTAAEGVDGTFFIDVDRPELTLLESTAGIPNDDDVPEKLRKTLSVTLAERSPDRKRFAYVDLLRFDKEAALVVVKADGSGERVVARGLPKAGHQVLWSPDGASIFVYLYESGATNDPNHKPVKNALLVASPDRTGVRKVWEEPEATRVYLGRMTYLPSRKAILYARENRIETIDVASGATGVLWQNDVPDTISLPQPSPDGTLVGVTTDGRISLVETATGRLRTTIAADDDPGRRSVFRFDFTPRGDRIVYNATGAEDEVGETDLIHWTSWRVANSFYYVVNVDGSGRRLLFDRHVGPSLSTIIER
jgi:hypothetical protein